MHRVSLFLPTPSSLPRITVFNIRPQGPKHQYRYLRGSLMGSSNEAPGIVHASAISTTTPTQVQDPVVQYVVLRKDLWQELKWPLGSVAAQACHAATAVMWMNRNDEVTCQYLSDENLDHMHKVVLEVKGESQLRDLSNKLEQAGIKHKLWTEQPEDFPTCLATKPYPKSQVAPHMKRLQLCKAPLSS